ncbi:MAG: 23S rRNA (adenine(2503)-C(2))-methyltransferase RlmN [Crocinitomicaceae bacterium]
MNAKRKLVREQTVEELAEYLKSNNFPSFRAKQIMDWLWKKNVGSFEEMKNIGKNLQEFLNSNFIIDKVSLKDQQISKDKTIKCAFEVDKNSIVEGVLIPTKKRMTACISSQVGCSLACTFCATGRLKLLRNLSAGEIYDQVFHLKNEANTQYQKSLSNIVYMGMGEPLLNYKNVLSSINWICSEEGLGMSPKRITLSTAGISKMIKKLGDDEVRFNLALSLHAANDEKRNKIMEINESNNLDSLRDALTYFYERTKSRVTFEYIIFDGFNDELSDARELAEFAKCVPCKINIIEYNPIDGEPFKQAQEDKVNQFALFLESLNMIVNVRRSRGKDIDAACGQLANKNKAILLDERKLKQ